MRREGAFEPGGIGVVGCLSGEVGVLRRQIALKGHQTGALRTELRSRVNSDDGAEGVADESDLIAACPLDETCDQGGEARDRGWFIAGRGRTEAGRSSTITSS